MAVTTTTTSTSEDLPPSTAATAYADSDSKSPTWKTEKSRGIIGGFVHLFFSRKFIAHRVFGLAFLIQYALSVYLYFADYDLYLRSPLWWSMPATGVIQSLTASYYFSFLPKKQVDPGYTTATSTLNYNFVKENIFFAMVLLFAFTYYHDATYPYWKAAWPIEALLVFLPYTWRRLFPKTSMRDALQTTERNKETNKTSEFLYHFFYYLTWITKAFYIWAKHYIGLFLNYVRFSNAHFTPEFQKELYLMLICGAFATTIALFLHTLRFKRYLPPVASFGLYVLSYMSTFYSYYRIGYIFFQVPMLTAAVFVGLLINLFSQVYLKSNLPFDAFQILMMVAAYNHLGPFAEQAI